jgi:hypothetical protein
MLFLRCLVKQEMKMETAANPVCNIDFSPKWYHDRFGLEFTERFWLDPIARTELNRSMRRVLRETFADVGLGEADPKPMPSIEAYGHRFMSAYWGCQIHYQPDQAPAAIALDDPAQRIESLQLPTIDPSPVVERAMKDAHLLADRYGGCEGSFNEGSPLNNAVSVLGEEILAAIVERPQAAQRILKLMAQAILTMHDSVTARINRTPPSSRRAIRGLGNCPVCMISPKSYEQVVLPVDQWYLSQIGGRGLHHCGAFHPYAEVYKKLEPDGLQIGYLSDRRISRAAFPNTPISLLLEASAIAGQTPAHVQTLVREMVDQAAPTHLVTDISVIDVGPEVSDEAVRAFVTSLPKVA